MNYFNFNIIHMFKIFLNAIFSKISEISGLDKSKDQSKTNHKNEQKLMKITEIPDYLRYNQWIKTGYRPALSTLGCLKSIIYLHNETFNILTHSIPLIYLVLFFNHLELPLELPSNQLPFNELVLNESPLNESLSDGLQSNELTSNELGSKQVNTRILAYFHIISCFTPWIGSSIYHIFMNHKSGESFYKRLLQWDVIGIWVTQSFGASTDIYTSVIKYPIWFRTSFIGLYIILALKALRASVNADNQWKRPASFAYLFIMRIFAFGLRMYSNSILPNNNKQLIHIIGQELWPILGAVVSATRIPERFWPGCFDYVLNSHNIMHCFVIFGAIHMHCATYNDLLWLSIIQKNYAL